MGRRGPGVTRGRKTYNELIANPEIHHAGYQFPPRFRYCADPLARPLTGGDNGGTFLSPAPRRAT